MYQDMSLESQTQMEVGRHPRRGQEGAALLLALIALCTFSALGIYMSFNSATEVRISDNYESHEQARQAALAGIAHARELLRGMDFSDALKGPDGAYTVTTPSRTIAFRNPLSWATARTVNVLDPTSAVAGVADDGLLNTGKAGTVNGITLIGLTGIAQTAPNPYGSGTIVTSRYFVKVTDNNGETSELAGDAADNPFVDGDKLVIVRSLGIARTIADGRGSSARSNSVVVFEARFRRTTTFDVNAPLIVEGDSVLPSAPSMFDGNAFGLHGGTVNYGIGTIDPNLSSGTPMPNQIKANLSINQRNNIQGVGGMPSVGDITGTLTSPDQQKLLDPNYLYTFATTEIPLIADQSFAGDQHWAGGNAPDLGTYDYRQPRTDPSQHPKVTYVNGNLDVQGNLSGGGILCVRGKLTGGGTFTFNGLVLVLGQGEMDLSGLNMGIHGGVFVANFTNSGGTTTFGTPKITMAGNSDIYVNADSLEVARELMAIKQIGLREVTSRTDP